MITSAVWKTNLLPGISRKGQAPRPALWFSACAFYRKDGLAWKPCGLHRSRWSRRPWDFHAIALEMEVWKLGSLVFLVGLCPTPRPFFFSTRNGGRRSRSAAKPQSDRWSPKRFAPPLASLRFQFSPDTTATPSPVAPQGRSVAVEGLALRACTLCSPFSVLRGALAPLPLPLERDFGFC